MGLVLLADPSKDIIGRYGLGDATLGKEVARPASFMIDRNGRVVWRHLPTDWRLRAGPDVYMDVFERVRRGELRL